MHIFSRIFFRIFFHGFSFDDSFADFLESNENCNNLVFFSLKRRFSLKYSSWISFEYFFVDFLSNILSRIIFRILFRRFFFEYSFFLCSPIVVPYFENCLQSSLQDKRRFQIKLLLIVKGLCHIFDLKYLVWSRKKYCSIVKYTHQI